MADTGYKYYKQKTGGEDYYEVLPNAGNTPTGYTEVSQQDFNTAEQSLRSANPTRWNPYFDQMRNNPSLKNAFTTGQSGIEMVNGVPTQTSAIQEQKQLASDPTMTNVGTAATPLYVPKGSAGQANMVNVGTNNTANAANVPVAPPVASPAAVDTSPLKAGFEAAMASGQEAPTTAGAAASAVKGFSPTPPAPATPTPTSPLEQMIVQDPGYQQLLADRAKYTNVANQGKSLLDFYNKAVTDAGIPAMNAELLNSKKIIDGTEDDIRKEVQATSGFATDSQVYLHFLVYRLECELSVL